MKLLRIYADTSTIGGCFDEEFAQDSLRLIEALQKKQFVLLLSQIVIKELEPAPERVRHLLTTLPTTHIERVEITNEIIELRNAYMDASILGPRWVDDATHVAAATVARTDAIVSWNFKHIVRLDKMKAYNRVNLLQGYGILTIISPTEVFFDDKPN